MGRRSLELLGCWIVPLAVVACGGGPGSLAGAGTSNGTAASNSQQAPVNPFQPLRTGVSAADSGGGGATSVNVTGNGDAGVTGGSCVSPSCKKCANDCATCLCQTNNDATVCQSLCTGP